MSKVPLENIVQGDLILVKGKKGNHVIGMFHRQDETHIVLFTEWCEVSGSPIYINKDTVKSIDFWKKWEKNE